MKGKELRALITLAGKVDPSLQAAMLKASNQGKKTSSTLSKAFGSINKGMLNVAGKISPSFQAGLTNVEKGASKAFGVVQKGAGAVGKGLQTAGKVAKGLAIGVGAVGAVGMAAITPLASQGLEYASSLTEVQNVVDTTFGKSASVIDNFSKSSLQSYGLSTLQAKQYSSVLGSMFKSMGLGSQQTLTMSQNMTALAGDMASFYNLQPDEAFEKIKAGISGETEPLKSLGINMSVANLQAYAMSKGIKTNYNSMTQAQQAQLRYNYLLNTTKDAQGDFSKTSGSFANQQKLIKTNLEQMSGTMMQKVMPALSTGMVQINKFITSMDTAQVGAFVGQLANMVVAFLPMVMQLMPIFGSLLQTLLPPIITIAQQIMPIVILALQTLLAVIQPILPPIIQVAQQLLPPIAQILTAIAPLLIQMATILGAVLGPVLSFVVGLIQKIADLISMVSKPFGDFLGKIGSLLGVSGKAQSTISSIGSTSSTAKVPAYAAGGFADSPSVFGEAGLEAAIPIRRGSARSLSLFAKTAQLLGVGGGDAGYSRGRKPRPFSPRPVGQTFGRPGPTIKFIYNPIFYGERPTERVLRKSATDVKRALDDYFEDRRRLAWEQ